jgi:hypothetical protein
MIYITYKLQCNKIIFVPKVVSLFFDRKYFFYVSLQNILEVWQQLQVQPNSQTRYRLEHPLSHKYTFCGFSHKK